MRKTPLDEMHLASMQPVLLRKLAEEVRRRQKDAETLCRGLGFELSDLSQPTLRFSYAQSSQFVRRALRLIPEPDLGLRLGATSNVIALGSLGLAMMASNSSHAILQLLVDMQDWVGCFLRLRIDRHPQRLSILVDTKFDDPELLPLLVDEALCRIARTVVFIAGPGSAPTGMELTIPYPPHWESYERLMGCPVLFGQPQNRLDFASVPVAVPTADPMIETGMRELLFQEMKVEHSSDLLAAVLNAIRRDPAHVPSLKEIAASMNIGERTLRRRLSAEGVSYAGMLAAERREHALTLVRTSAESMTKIAANTGFSDSRSLRRAIKRWTGNKPTNLRRQSKQR